MKQFFYSWFAIENAGGDNEDFGSDSGYIEAESAEVAEAAVRSHVEDTWEYATITIEIEDLGEI